MGQDQQGSWSVTGMAVHEPETGTPDSYDHTVTEDLELSPGPMGRGWRLQVGLVRAIKTY